MGPEGKTSCFGEVKWREMAAFWEATGKDSTEFSIYEMVN